MRWKEVEYELKTNVKDMPIGVEPMPILTPCSSLVLAIFAELPCHPYFEASPFRKLALVLTSVFAMKTTRQMPTRTSQILKKVDIEFCSCVYAYYLLPGTCTW